MYPWEVEARIGSHPVVQHVAMVGVADPRVGEAACVCVVPSKGAIVTDQVRAELSSPEQRWLRDSFGSKGVAASKVDVPAGLPLTSVVL